MKLLTLLLASILSAQVITTHFKEVNYNGVIMRDVTMVTDDEAYTTTLWYRENLLLDKYILVSCRTAQGYCLVEKASFYGWLERKR